MKINKIPTGSNLTIDELNDIKMKINTEDEVKTIVETITGAIASERDLTFDYILYDVNNDPIYKLKYKVIPKTITDTNEGQALLCRDTTCISEGRENKSKLFQLKAIKNIQ